MKFQVIRPLLYFGNFSRFLQDKGYIMNYEKSSPETIQTLFSKIASRYDLCNKALSFNLHKRWNKKLVNLLLGSGENILDLCAGTGDIAFEFKRNAPNSKVTLLDFCEPMLAVAKSKAEVLGHSFEFVQGDATKLPFGDKEFSQVSVAYGIRNVQDPVKCMAEAYRVLKPGGVFGILELTRPENWVVRVLHSWYLKVFVPLIGRLITGNKEAYQYLDQSIKNFQLFKSQLESVGFQEVRVIPLTFGIASIIVAKKL